MEGNSRPATTIHRCPSPPSRRNPWDGPAYTSCRCGSRCRRGFCPVARSTSRPTTGTRSSRSSFDNASRCRFLSQTVLISDRLIPIARTYLETWPPCWEDRRRVARPARPRATKLSIPAARSVWTQPRNQLFLLKERRSDRMVTRSKQQQQQQQQRRREYTISRREVEKQRA